jgi:hypothetical protein
MTKKDYVALAAVLKLSKPKDGGPHATIQWRLDVENVASALQDDNPKFNRKTFLVAVGF